jgi:phage/plasmid-associated DNA primase
VENILEEKLNEVSNRSSIKDAVTAVAKLDYAVLKAASTDNKLIDVDSDKEVSEIEKLTSDDSIDYAMLHQNHEKNYSLNSDYLSKLAGTKSSSVVYEDDNKEEKYNDTQAETLTTEEAEETMEDICWSSMMGNKSEVSYIERRKLSNWIMFNPALFKLFEAQAMTREINYTEF